MFANDRHGIQIMNQQLSIHCPPAVRKTSLDVTTPSPEETKSLSTTVSVNKCSDVCFSRLRILEKKIEELNTESMDLKNKFDMQNDVLKEMNEKIVATSEIVSEYDEKFEEIDREIKDSSICVWIFVKLEESRENFHQFTFIKSQ